MSCVSADYHTNYTDMSRGKVLPALLMLIIRAKFLLRDNLPGEKKKPEGPAFICYIQPGASRTNAETLCGSQSTHLHAWRQRCRKTKQLVSPPDADESLLCVRFVDVCSRPGSWRLCVADHIVFGSRLSHLLTRVLAFCEITEQDTAFARSLLQLGAPP